MLKLALVQIALGKKNEAVATLKRPPGARRIQLRAGAGARRAPAEAIRVLEPAARDANADATVRQNLALAYAFAGNWDNARAIAAQDVPAGPARHPHPPVDAARIAERPPIRSLLWSA